MNSKDFSYENLFEEIDSENLGYIDFNNLFEFFRKNAFYPYEEEIIAILRRLDKNDDGRLNFDELIEAIETKTLEKTQNYKGKASKNEEKMEKIGKIERNSKTNIEKNEKNQMNFEKNEKNTRISQINPEIPQKNLRISQISQINPEIPQKNLRISQSKVLTIEEKITALNTKLRSEKKKSVISEEKDYEFPIKEPKTNIKNADSNTNLTEKKPENIKKSSIHQEIISKNKEKLTETITKSEEIPPDYSFCTKKPSNFGSNFSNTPPKYPRSKQYSSQIIEKTPPHHNYYPYEPVRRAFSPMKEQIMKNSRTPPRKTDFSNEKPVFSEKKTSLSNSKKFYEEKNNENFNGDFNENSEEKIEEKPRNSREIVKKRESFEEKTRISNYQQEKRASLKDYQEKYQEKPQKESKFATNEEKPQVFSDEKRLSNARKSNCEEKPQIYSDDKRIMKDNEKKISIYEEKPTRFSMKNQENPIILPEDKRNSTRNTANFQEKPLSSLEEKRFSAKNDQIYQEKPLISSEIKRPSNYSEKTPSIISQKPSKTSVIPEKDKNSNYESSEKSIDLLQEKARLQSLKIDEIIKKEGVSQENKLDSEKKTRNSDLGFYSKIEYNNISKNLQRKSAPLIFGHNSAENDSISSLEKNSINKKNRNIIADLQVKEESENDDTEEEINRKIPETKKSLKKSVITENFQNKKSIKNGKIDEKFDEKISEKSSEKSNEKPNEKINGKINEKNNGKFNGKIEKKCDISMDIVNYFKNLINCEEELEKCKQDLALRPDFNLVDFFLFFDKGKQGFCGREEFEEVLSELGLQFQQQNLQLFLQRFIKGEAETLKFYDFSEAFLPFLSDYAELLNQRKPINIDFQFKYREVNDFTLKKPINFKRVFFFEKTLKFISSSFFTLKKPDKFQRVFFFEKTLKFHQFFYFEKTR